MSSLPETGNWKSGKMSRVSRFSLKCSLLSKYLKENVTFGDKNFGVTAQPEALGFAQPSNPRQCESTVNYKSKVEQPAETSTNLKSSMDFLPKLASFSPTTASMKEKTDFMESAAMESGTAQMTILYGGQILVFDDFPADKIQEIISLAAYKPSTSSPNNSRPVVAEAGSKTGSNNTIEQYGPKLDSGDLPIARKASLHRFLKKRKYRVAKCPYQVDQSAAPALKPEEGDQFLNMEGQSSQAPEQLELKL